MLCLPLLQKVVPFNLMAWLKSPMGMMAGFMVFAIVIMPYLKVRIVTAPTFYPAVHEYALLLEGCEDTWFSCSCITCTPCCILVLQDGVAGGPRGVQAVDGGVKAGKAWAATSGACVGRWRSPAGIAARKCTAAVSQ